MTFQETTLPGAYLIEPKRINDDRGFFARIWCKKELQQRGLKSDMVQSNVGFSYRKGTLRGLHLQKFPYAEVKIVRCTRGAIFDVIVDLRLESPSYKRWFGIELSDENGKMIYVPEGFAHGFLVLEDNTEMMYKVTDFYYPQGDSGILWNDPDLNISWPFAEMDISSPILSEKDTYHPRFSEIHSPFIYKRDES